MRRREICTRGVGESGKGVEGGAEESEMNGAERR